MRELLKGIRSISNDRFSKPIRVRSKDEFGEDVNYKHYFILYDPQESTMNVSAINWFTSVNNKCEPGDKAQFLVGTKDKDVSLLYEVEHKGKIVIDSEINNAQQGKTAAIDIKMNSLEDRKIIQKLYEASNAGVKIRVNVRGICCLIPGIKNMSENIEIISIIDRYLEHARVYIFHNGGRKKVYLASADMMSRNLSRRIEVAFPIYEKELQDKLIHIFNLQWQDDVKARIIDALQQNKYKDKSPEYPQRSQLKIYEYLKTQR